MKNTVITVICVGCLSVLGFCVHGLLDSETENQPQKSITIVTDTYEIGEPGYTIIEEDPEFIETVKCNNRLSLVTGKMGWEVETYMITPGSDLIYNASKSNMTYEQAKVERCRQHKEAWDTVAKIKELKALKCN
jgi:hypothetical protein